MNHSSINLDLCNKLLKIHSIENINKNLAKKLSNLGIYKNQIIILRKIGNTKNMIGIEFNDIINVFRLDEVKDIQVIEVINE